MPGDSLSFAVFIGREPDIFGRFNGFFPFGNDFALFGVDLVLRLKAVSDVDRWRAIFGLLNDRTNVSNGRQHGKILTEVFLDRLGLGRTLYYDKIFAHASLLLYRLCAFVPKQQPLILPARPWFVNSDRFFYVIMLVLGGTEEYDGSRFHRYQSINGAESNNKQHEKRRYFMTGMPRPTADTNPVGRHGRIGVDILPRELDLPVFERPRPQLDEEVGVVAMSAVLLTEAQSTYPVPRAEHPDDRPGLYL